MNAILLKTDGLIVLDQKTVETELLKILSFQVELEKDYTLRSYFEMMETYNLFAEINVFFPACREQYLACPESGCCFDDVDYLEFGKTVEMIGFPNKSLEIYNSLKGNCGHETIEVKSLHLTSLLDLPVKLGKLKHIVFGDRVDIFEFDTVYTLFEFIDGVAWELSFHGTPDHCEIRR